MTRTWTAALLLGALPALALTADDPKPQAKNIVATDPASAGPDFAIQGEYEGEATVNGEKFKVGAQVIADGNGKFTIRYLKDGLPGAGWDGETQRKATAKTEDGKVSVTGDSASGEIAGGKLTVKGDTAEANLTKVERNSPTLDAK